MIDVILEKFTEISKKCLARYAKNYSTENQKVQLIFKLNKEEEVEYMITKEYVPQQVISFLEVLGVKLDFKGYSLFVPKFIKGSLLRFCEEHKIEKGDVRVMLFLNQSDKLIMWLYNSNKPVKEVTLQSLFNEEDMLSEENS